MAILQEGCTLLFMLVVHSYTTVVQTRVRKQFVLISLKYHSLHLYTHRLPSKGIGWQKLGIFMRRTTTLYPCCSHILPWRIFCQRPAIISDRPLDSWTTVYLFHPPSHPLHHFACHRISLKGEVHVWMQTNLPPPAANLSLSSQCTTLTRPRPAL